MMRRTVHWSLLQDSFFNDNRDNFCDNVFVSRRMPVVLPCKCCLYYRFDHLSCHANIVQRVKSCYKIKIGFRDLSCCFCVVLLHLWHPDLSIQPLLHSNSNPIKVQKRLYCMTTVAVLECKRGSIATQRCLFCSVIHCTFLFIVA